MVCDRDFSIFCLSLEGFIGFILLRSWVGVSRSRGGRIFSSILL